MNRRRAAEETSQILLKIPKLRSSFHYARREPQPRLQSDGQGCLLYVVRVALRSCQAGEPRIILGDDPTVWAQ